MYIDINKRFGQQTNENESQSTQLQQIAQSTTSINTRNALIKTKIEQFKARNDELEQRILKVSSSMPLIHSFIHSNLSVVVVVIVIVIVFVIIAYN